MNTTFKNTRQGFAAGQEESAKLWGRPKSWNGILTRIFTYEKWKYLKFLRWHCTWVWTLFIIFPDRTSFSWKKESCFYGRELLFDNKDSCSWWRVSFLCYRDNRFRCYEKNVERSNNFKRHQVYSMTLYRPQNCLSNKNLETISMW